MDVGDDAVGFTLLHAMMVVANIACICSLISTLERFNKLETVKQILAVWWHFGLSYLFHMN